MDRYVSNMNDMNTVETIIEQTENNNDIIIVVDFNMDIGKTNRSLIDHVLCTKETENNITQCKICPDTKNTNDHTAIITEIALKSPLEELKKIKMSKHYKTK